MINVVKMLGYFLERVEYLYIMVQEMSLKKTDGVILTLSKTSPDFYVSAIQDFIKHSRKWRNCSTGAIYPFPTVFSTHLKNFL